MGDLLQQSQAEATILSYKLDKIRNYIESRINNVDTITRNELSAIMNMISKYEIVESNWVLKKPLVELNDLEKENLE